jgi:hypothetical protein
VLPGLRGPAWLANGENRAMIVDLIWVWVWLVSIWVVLSVQQRRAPGRPDFARLTIIDHQGAAPTNP